MPMSEVEHFRMEESAAEGKFIAEVAKAIFDAHDARTMRKLQERVYADTDAGIAISFQLHDESFVWVGDQRAAELAEPWNHVRAIGASSIVENSDVEVPLKWIDLARYLDDEKYDETAVAVAVADFDELCEEINSEACRLWDEAVDNQGEQP